VRVHIALVTQQLIELFSIRALGSLHLAAQLKDSGFDISLLDTQIFNMLMELRLQLMATIGSDLLDTKRELGDDVVNKGHRVPLRVTIVNL
jgi:hypothetical protein